MAKILFFLETSARDGMGDRHSRLFPLKWAAHAKFSPLFALHGGRTCPRFSFFPSLEREARVGSKAVLF